jgi:hypothetical protein
MTWLRGRSQRSRSRRGDRWRESLEWTFAEIVGIGVDGTVEEGDNVYRKELSTGSGISDGHVSLHFWKFTGPPILVDRWAAAAGE